MHESEIRLSEAIGQRLREARHRAGWSLTTLSERTGGQLSKSRISNYEQGIRRMGIQEARLLATALGTVTPAFLLCIEDALDLTADERDLIKHYRATDAQGRAAVAKTAAAEAKRAATVEAVSTPGH